MSNAGKVWDIREAYKKQRGNQWDAGNGSKALVGGGYTPSNTNKIETFNIAVAGNATDFGDLRGTVGEAQSGASPTRAFWARGGSTEQVNFEAGGNTANFVSLGITPRTHGAAGDSTRSMFMGNGAPAFSNTVEYIETANSGFKADFGNLSNGTDRGGALSSPTRTLFAGGEKSDGNNTNAIDFFTTATTGNATDFGDLTVANRHLGGAGSTTRGLFFNSYTTTRIKTVDVVQIASTGNATDFGDMTTAVAVPSSTSNKTRAVRCGGSTPTLQNTIEFVTIATTGDGTDFGDLTEAKSGTNTCSNGHGGLDLGVLPRSSVTHMPGSGRGLVQGVGVPFNTNVDLVHIPTAGNSSDFGDTTSSRNYAAGASSLTRGIAGGGSSPSAVNVIDVTEMASRGTYSDFGDTSVTRARSAGNVCSPTRALFSGGDTPTKSDVIDYITMASVGNATDFGNLTVARTDAAGGLSSSVRGVVGGGATPSTTESNIMDYVTIASTGDSTDFGDLSAGRTYLNGVSSSTRGVFGSGITTPSSPYGGAILDYITIASTGNATDFGDPSQNRYGAAGMSNSIRGVFAGGRLAPNNYNTIDFITIASTGNAADFGDLSNTGECLCGASDNHGGLQA